MPDIATTEPSTFISGDTVQWKIAEDDDYPIASLWVLHYAFVNQKYQFQITCTDNGDNYHLATITAATSSTIVAGDYQWQSYITDGTDRHNVNSGSLTVLPNFAVMDDGYDARSFWKTVLENVEAVIKGRATKDQSSYTINGRQLSRTPVADLLKLYDKAKYFVAQEERAEAIDKGLGTNGTIKVRF